MDFILFLADILLLGTTKLLNKLEKLITPKSMPKIDKTPSEPGFKPNAVLFKADSGKVCIVKKELGAWNWDGVLVLDNDYWPDINVSPFEFIFVNFTDLKISTDISKTIVKNHSFLSLYKANILQDMIEDDFQRRFSQYSR